MYLKYSKSLLCLMQLISANFPIGNFSYSRGLEWAVECGWINSVETFSNWQKQWIFGSLVYLEWPMLKRCYFYTQIEDKTEFLKCVFKILAYQSTYELRLEERQRGQAITRLIMEWDFDYSCISLNEDWLFGLRNSGLAAIAWLGYRWGISMRDLALGYAYNFLESSVIVGLKLVPFGSSVAQKLLKNLTNLLPDIWEQFYLIKDCDLGSSFPMQSIASACHETQYSRLFRS